MEHKTLQVNGMNCGHCVKAIESALGALPGLSGVSAYLNSRSVSFNYDPALTQLAAVEAAIVDAGYEIAR